MIVIALGLGYFYALKQPAAFLSQARMLARVAPVVNEADAGPPATSQDRVLHSRNVVESAIRNHRLDRLASLAGQPDVAATILANLKVRPVPPDFWVLELSYRGASADDCQVVLLAVIESYRQLVGETHFGADIGVIDVLTEARNELLPQLRQASLAEQDFRDQSRWLVQGQAILEVEQRRLAEAAQRHAGLSAHLQQTRDAVDVIQRALETGDSSKALALLSDEFQARSERQAAETAEGNKQNSVAARLSALYAEEAGLLKQYGASHPHVKSVRQQIEVLRELARANIDRVSNEVLDLIAREQTLLLSYGPRHPQVQAVRRRIGELGFPSLQLNLNRPEAAANDERPADAANTEQHLRDRLAILQRELELDQQRLDDLQRDLTTGRDKLREIDQELATAARLKAESDMLQAMFDAAVARLTDLHLARDRATSATRVLEPPSPARQVAPNTPLILLQFALGGLIFGLVLRYLVHLARAAKPIGCRFVQNGSSSM